MAAVRSPHKQRTHTAVAVARGPRPGPSGRPAPQTSQTRRRLAHTQAPPAPAPRAPLPLTGLAPRMRRPAAAADLTAPPPPALTRRRLHLGLWRALSCGPGLRDRGRALPGWGASGVNTPERAPACGARTCVRDTPSPAGVGRPGPRGVPRRLPRCGAAIAARRRLSLQL